MSGVCVASEIINLSVRNNEEITAVIKLLHINRLMLIEFIDCCLAGLTCLMMTNECLQSGFTVVLLLTFEPIPDKLTVQLWYGEQVLRSRVLFPPM